MNFPLGWIPFTRRTLAMNHAHDAALLSMRPQFMLTGSAPDPGPLVNLMATWKHDKIIKTLGGPFPGIRQVTGSCVGAGGGNACFTLGAIEILLNNEAEELIIPFWLLPYGISRMLIGESSEGEGSLGSAFAEAVVKYGVFGQQESNVPKYENSDGFCWGQQNEMRWSNGRAIKPEFLNIAKKHLIKSAAPIKSAAEGRDAIRNGYPLTFASPWFMTPGAERLQGSKEPAVVGALSSNGGHQTSIEAVWDHPELGLIFWNENQWQRKTYKEDPTIGSGSGCFMTERDFDKVAKSRDGEIYALSQYDGYPAQSIPWSSILPL